MQNGDKDNKTIRWYDGNETLQNAMQLLQDLPDSFKRQVATYLVQDIISRKPYCDMLTLDAHYLIMSEDRRRRWYDFDEAFHIFIELVRHSSEDQRTIIAELVIQFICNLKEAQGQ